MRPSSTAPQLVMPSRTRVSLQDRADNIPQPLLDVRSAFWDDTPYGVGHMLWQLETISANHSARKEIEDLLRDATEDERWGYGFFGYYDIPLWKETIIAFENTVPPLLREIIGNPFRPVTFSPQWLTDTAVSLARQMYDARDFSAMPILAYALQDAGCDSDDILNHCRQPGEHVRGCWVVDLVLGKE